MTARHLILPALTALAACQGADTGTVDVTSYELALRPLVPSNQQDLFQKVDSVSLIVEPNVGTPTEYELTGVTSEGYSQVLELPALEDTTLALVGRTNNQVTAFGRSEEFSISEGTLDLPILVGDVDKLGWLGSMPIALFGGAIVSDKPGRFLIIGGTTKEPDSTTGVSSSILSFNVAAPSDDLGFEIVGQLPTDEDAGDGRVGHVAVYLDGPYDDAGKVLIAGGSAGMKSCSTATDSVLLWDPETGEFEELGREGRLDSPRMLLRSAVDSAGNIVMAAGAAGCSSGNPEPSALVHIYSPAERNNEDDVIDYEGDMPSWMPAMARLNDEGVIICGGVDFESGYTTYSISDQCHRMSVGTVLHSNEFQLPTPMAWHDMVTLADGSVLFTGGFQSSGADIGSSTTQEASDRAWIYDGNTWREVGHMHHARAMHRSTLLPDGRVLVVGGVSEAGAMRWFDAEDAIACAELFDPDTGAFTQVDDCDDTDDSSSLQGRTAHLMIGADAQYGVLVAGGLDDDESPTARAALFISATAAQ